MWPRGIPWGTDLVLQDAFHCSEANGPLDVRLNAALRGTAMFVRHACFEGTVAPEDRERFAAIVREQVAPGMSRFPRLRRLSYHWGREYEADDRQFYLIIEHAYDSPQDMEAAISSEPRREMQGAIEELVGLFQGRVYHVNCEVDVVVPN